MSKRKADDDFKFNKSFRNKYNSSSSEESNNNENRYENISDLQNSQSEKFVPSSLNLGLGKLNIGAINNPNRYNDDHDGYETDETVLEEDYVPPADWVEPKSSYKSYLEDRKKRLEQYDEGYETDDTVILDEDGNYKKGGKIHRLLKRMSHKKRKSIRKRSFKKIIKKSYKKKSRKIKRNRTKKYNKK